MFGRGSRRKQPPGNHNLYQQHLRCSTYIPLSSSYYNYIYIYIPFCDAVFSDSPAKLLTAGFRLVLALPLIPNRHISATVMASINDKQNSEGLDRLSENIH